MCELKSFSFRLPQFKEEAKSYLGANMKKVTENVSSRLMFLWAVVTLLTWNR